MGDRLPQVSFADVRCVSFGGKEGGVDGFDILRLVGRIAVKDSSEQFLCSCGRGVDVDLGVVVVVDCSLFVMVGAHVKSLKKKHRQARQTAKLANFQQMPRLPVLTQIQGTYILFAEL